MLCLLGTLAGGESVAVAVGVSDMLHVTVDMQHMTPEITHIPAKKTEACLFKIK